MLDAEIAGSVFSDTGAAPEAPHRVNMAFLLHRIRAVANVAGAARAAALDQLVRERPHLARAFIDGDLAAQAAAQVEILDHFDVERRAHSVRLARGCVALARALDLPERRVADIELGALFHDIGKLAVPAAILDSPLPLDPRSLDLVRMHSSLGHACLFGLAGLEVAAEMVLAHHEYWDGSGYPRGLRGEAIAIEARLFAVIDSYDAMVRDDRLYRCAVDHRSAVAEIATLAGRKYDPDVTAAFVAIADIVGDDWQASEPPGARAPRPATITG